MPDNLLKETSEYFGFLGERPRVPLEEVWVFQSRKGDIRVFGLSDGEVVGRTPPPPWLKRNSMGLYKFWKAATYDWTISVFDGSGFPVDVTLSVTATLYDPEAYIQTGFYDNLREKLKAPLTAALREALALELQGQFDLQVVPVSVHDLSLPTLKQLLPDADLSRYIQGREDFRKNGVQVRAVVLRTKTSPMYESLVQNAVTALNQQLLGAKQMLVDAATRLEIGLGELEYREKLYNTLPGYYDHIYPTIKSTLEKLIEQAGGVAREGLEPAMATIFKDMVRPAVEAAVRVGVGRNQSAGVVSDSVGGFASPGHPGREHQIKALYAAASEEGWRLSPPLDQFLRNRGAEITVDVGEMCKVRVRLPSNFPQVAPILQATRDGVGVGINEVKAATAPLLMDMQGTGDYDLGSLVKAVAERIRPGAQTDE